MQQEKKKVMSGSSAYYGHAQEQQMPELRQRRASICNFIIHRLLNLPLFSIIILCSPFESIWVNKCWKFLLQLLWSIVLPKYRTMYLCMHKTCMTLSRRRFLGITEQQKNCIVQDKKGCMQIICQFDMTSFYKVNMKEILYICLLYKKKSCLFNGI